MAVWYADKEFRSGLKRDPQTQLEKWKLDVDLEALRVLWDGSESLASSADQYHPAVRGFLEWQSEFVQLQERLHNEAGNAPIFYRQWRERQIGRFMTQNTPSASKATGHYPFVIELTRGCSVGCGYCALAAPALDGVARFNQGNEELFGSILVVLSEFFGEAAKTGFLYWATEPLDNKDYEKFLYAFYEEFGVTPQTTTAAWGRNVRRTKHLLEQSSRCNGVPNRFSINSLEQLHVCLEKFTAEELMDVLLVPQMPGGTTVQVAAGRGVKADPDAVIGTIACVTGFLINLVDHSVKLISPCTDLKNWPLGYCVYRESSFEDVDELREFLETCEREIMSVSFDDEFIPKIRDDLTKNPNQLSSELVFSTEFGELTFDDELQAAILLSIDGYQSVRQVVRRLMKVYDPAMIYFNFRRLYDAGLFESLPVRTTAHL